MCWGGRGGYSADGREERGRWGGGGEGGGGAAEEDAEEAAAEGRKHEGCREDTTHSYRH